MPVKRDKSGNIIEQPTEQSGGYQPGGGKAPEPESPPASDSPYDQPTVVSRVRKTAGTVGGGVAAGTGVGGAATDNARTQIYRGGKKGQPATTSQAEAPAPNIVAERSENEAMDNPPVGWLVVVKGPGCGRYVVLGHGMNSIGRDANERCVIDFGDQTISRSAHAVVSYDARNKQFFIQGGGTNLIYIDDQPILQAQVLQPHTEIHIGETTLRFVSLCGENFNWE